MNFSLLVCCGPGQEGLVPGDVVDEGVHDQSLLLCVHGDPVDVDAEVRSRFTRGQTLNYQTASSLYSVHNPPHLGSWQTSSTTHIDLLHQSHLEIFL